MVNLQQQQKEFSEAQVKTVVVVMAEPEQALSLIDKFGLTYLVLCDPHQIAYQHFGIQQGRPMQYIGPKTWLAGLRAMIRGGMGKPSYDIKQMHGTIVIDSSGAVIYRHLGRHSADYTPLADVLSATK
ncbi:MAG: hypothetical protein CMJ76_17195 [Planctomycetaceae bacterium]|nr:hypothetical protein [Planctomycetaceae bacterium]|tara:strand:+ start:7752 stop:8135 length:384 start_codon:yes stop_codon:yes gene_type:complete